MSIRDAIERASTWPKCPPSSQAAIEKCSQELCLKFPNDYVEFLLISNGAEGFPPEGVRPGCFILWAVEKVSEMNKAYEVQEKFPGYLAIGTNGGGELFLINTLNDESQPVLMIPAVDYELEVARKIGKNFADFLENISKG